MSLRWDITIHHSCRCELRRFAWVDWGHCAPFYCTYPLLLCSTPPVVLQHSLLFYSTPIVVLHPSCCTSSLLLYLIQCIVLDPIYYTVLGPFECAALGPSNGYHFSLFLARLNDIRSFCESLLIACLVLLMLRVVYTLRCRDWVAQLITSKASITLVGIVGRYNSSVPLRHPSFRLRCCCFWKTFFSFFFRLLLFPLLLFLCHCSLLLVCFCCCLQS